MVFGPYMAVLLEGDLAGEGGYVSRKFVEAEKGGGSVKGSEEDKGVFPEVS